MTEGVKGIDTDDMEYLGVGESLDSYNLFVYCGNNPVMGYDPAGNWDPGGLIVGGSMPVTSTVAAVAPVACGRRHSNTRNRETKIIRQIG